MAIYQPKEIPAISAPISAANRRNAHNHPAVDLGCCTPSQLFSKADISLYGTVCFLGKPSRGIEIARALIRRSKKPFLFIGTKEDANSAFCSLQPMWTQNNITTNLPNGSGAILLFKPYESYLEICNCIENLAQDYILIFHLGRGVQIGAGLLNRLCAVQQCLIFCESIPQSIQSTEGYTITVSDFLKRMNYLFVFSSGAETKELIELLPTYQYEKISNTEAFNSFRGRSILHPFHGHRTRGISISQTRTKDFSKHVFEMDELMDLFSVGYLLVYNAPRNTVFLTHIV